MLTSTSLAALSIAPAQAVDTVQRTRVPAPPREEPPQVPPPNATQPVQPSRPAEPGSRVLPRGSLLDLSI
jgi:hypothetical protein